VPIILEHKGSASKSQKEMPTDLWTFLYIMYCIKTWEYHPSLSIEKLKDGQSQVRSRESLLITIARI
jgi:hypothetical protein